MASLSTTASLAALRLEDLEPGAPEAECHEGAAAGIVIDDEDRIRRIEWA